jgi:hypothetical protein
MRGHLQAYKHDLHSRLKVQEQRIGSESEEKTENQTTFIGLYRRT